MRIVYISASDIPSQYANSIQVMRMCEALAQHGHEVTLIGKQFQVDSSCDVYEYYGVRRNFRLDLIPCRKIKGVNLLTLPQLYGRLRRYDSHAVLIYARNIYGASLAVRMGFRVIYEAHAAPYNGLIRHLEASLLKNPRLIRLVVVSEALKRLYTSQYDIADKVVVCHDAASVPDETLKVRVSWPACRDTLQIGYTGHLYPGRGIEIILECAKQLPQHDFHVIGGTGNDVRLWETQVTANVHFHGFLEPAAIHAARAMCDVLLMPYQREIINPHSHLNTVPWMSPLKLFEYMASQKAIIASDLPVLREVLDEQKAVLVEPDDPGQWVYAVRQCEDRAYRENLARNAYAAFLEHHTWEKRAQRVLQGVAG